jgi:mannose-6-phosphate isomerase-like protein (cupin superfamily)
MVEVKNFFQEVDSHPEVRNFKLWKTEFSTFWIINSDPKVQDDMHYHENDDHIFMVLEGEGLVRTPHKEYTNEAVRYRRAYGGTALSALQYR